MHDVEGRQATLPLSLLDPDLSRVVLRTRVHAHSCSTLLTSLVAWHLGVVHVDCGGTRCRLKLRQVKNK